MRGSTALQSFMSLVKKNIARIANAVQVTLLSLFLPLSLKSLSKVTQKSPKTLSKVSQKSLKGLSKVSLLCLLVSTSVY